jgi:hypothetical protein
MLPHEPFSTLQEKIRYRNTLVPYLIGMLHVAAMLAFRKMHLPCTPCRNTPNHCLLQVLPAHPGQQRLGMAHVLGARLKRGPH